MNKKALCTGLFAGVTAGAAAALLYAPQSGRELRGKVKDAQVSATLTSMEIKENANQIKESVKHLVDIAKQNVPEMITSVKVNAALWKESIEPNIQALQTEITGIQKTVEDLQKSLPTSALKK